MSGCINPKSFRRERVPEFVQHHAKKKKQNKYDSARRHCGTALRVIAEGQPDNQQQERDVNPQLDAGDAEDWERPAHLSQFALVLNRAPVPPNPTAERL